VYHRRSSDTVLRPYYQKEIKEVQNSKTIMFNELEVGARKRAEVDEVKQRFEDIYFSAN
jgi:hypothetical protein